MQPISIVFTLPEDVVLQINQALAAGEVGVTALSREISNASGASRFWCKRNRTKPVTLSYSLDSCLTSPIDPSLM